jgi:hypothetical protein
MSLCSEALPTRCSGLSRCRRSAGALRAAAKSQPAAQRQACQPCVAAARAAAELTWKRIQSTAAGAALPKVQFRLPEVQFRLPKAVARRPHRSLRRPAERRLCRSTRSAARVAMLTRGHSCRTHHDAARRCRHVITGPRHAASVSTCTPSFSHLLSVLCKGARWSLSKWHAPPRNRDAQVQGDSAAFCRACQRVRAVT